LVGFGDFDVWDLVFDVDDGHFFGEGLEEAADDEAGVGGTETEVGAEAEGDVDC
jgi:hypothetical protein